MEKVKKETDGSDHQFKDRFTKIFGPKKASLMLDFMKDHPDMFRRLTLYAFGFTLKDLIFAFLGFLFASFGIPYLLIVVFSIKNGLPVFDAVEAFGANSAMFAVICCLFTASIIAFLLIPGIVWSLDSSVRDTSWFVQDEFGNEEYWLRLRWALSFFPGVFLAAVAVFVFALSDSDPLIASFGKQLLIYVSFAIIFFLIGSYIAFKAGWIGKKLSRERVRFLCYRVVFRKPSNFLMTNTAASVFFFVYAAISYKFVEHLYANNDFDSVASINIIFVVLTSILFLTLSSIWAIKLDIWKAASAILGVALIVFSFWPGFLVLLQNYMSMMRVGGGTTVLVTLDIDKTKNWADFLKSNVETSSDKFVRVGPVSLVLLGKEKVFIRLQSNDDPSGFRGPIVLDRSRVRAIMFLENK